MIVFTHQEGDLNWQMSDVVADQRLRVAKIGDVEARIRDIASGRGTRNKLSSYIARKSLEALKPVDIPEQAFEHKDWQKLSATFATPNVGRAPQPGQTAYVSPVPIRRAVTGPPVSVTRVLILASVASGIFGYWFINLPHGSPAKPAHKCSQTVETLSATFWMASHYRTETEDGNVLPTGCTNLSSCESGSDSSRQRTDEWLATLLMAGWSMEASTTIAQQPLPLPVRRESTSDVVLVKSTEQFCSPLYPKFRRSEGMVLGRISMMSCRRTSDCLFDLRPPLSKSDWLNKLSPQA
ncbi:hypothetical protein ACVIGA_005126 [Bradyrhizobium sp. USDA 3240]